MNFARSCAGPLPKFWVPRIFTLDPPLSDAARAAILGESARRLWASARLILDEARAMTVVTHGVSKRPHLVQAGKIRVLALEPDSLARIPQFSGRTWIGLALLTFFHNYFANVPFFNILQHLDAIQTALCNYLITFLGVPIAAIWLGERLTAGAVAVWESRRNASDAPQRMVT